MEALLRVYLENVLIDQQFLHHLKPGEEREIETSLYNPSAQPKPVYFTLYDISDKTPRLLFIQRYYLE